LKEIFDGLDEWFGKRPQIKLPHIWDLLNPGDTNFPDHKDCSEDEVEVFDETVGEDLGDPVDTLACSTPTGKKLVSTAGCTRGMSPSFGQGSSP
jgi:hypothetical protein